QKKYWKNLKIFKTTNPELRSLKAFSYVKFTTISEQIN
ncbi:uncharacterized protein METZ01_LOCUS377777, partial [marine metagenome]